MNESFEQKKNYEVAVKRAPSLGSDCLEATMVTTCLHDLAREELYMYMYIYLLRACEPR